MASGLNDAVIGSYSSYLKSFARTSEALSDGVQSSADLVSAILLPFKTAGVDDLLSDELQSRTGLDPGRYEAGIRQATSGGLISVEKIDGTKHVILLPIGHAALGAAV